MHVVVSGRILNYFYNFPHKSFQQCPNYELCFSYDLKKSYFYKLISFKFILRIMSYAVYFNYSLVP